MSHQLPDIHILYATQTGVSEEIAQRIYRTISRIHLQHATLSVMDSFDYRSKFFRENTNSDATIESNAIHAPPAYFIFVCSTSGQGTPPVNMQSFWKYCLLRKHTGQSLNHVHYTVFGLGDSGYPKFNFVAKKLYRRLLQLGAKPFFERGYGDDQHPWGIEGGFQKWNQELKQKFLELFPLNERGLKEIDDSRPFPSLYRIVKHQATSGSNIASKSQINKSLDNEVNQDDNKPVDTKLSIDLSHELNKNAMKDFNSDLNYNLNSESNTTSTKDSSKISSSVSNHINMDISTKSNLVWDMENSPYIDHSKDLLASNTILYERSTFGILRVNERLTPSDHWQDVRHLVLDIKGTGLRYLPGDAVAIMYLNPSDYVDKFLKRLNLEGDTPISFERIHTNSPNFLFHHHQLTWREIFTKYLDITGTPTRFFYEQLLHFITDPNEKERLEYLLSPEATDDFWRYNQREKRTYLEALEDFASAHPPEEYILDIVRPIMPRYFSISSSQALNPDEIHLTVAIVEFKTPFERIRYGKCTRWIRDCAIGTKIPMWISKGTFHLAPNEAPLIMVGPGTGMAPFRSFIQERHALAKKGEKVGSSTLFFGSRNEKKDFFYAEDWMSLKSELPLNVITAFSRDQSQKIYVQHRILENAELIWNHITFEGAYFYIAGNANDMPKGVRNMMIQVAQKCGGKSYQEAEEWIQRLEKQNRYQEETW